MNKTTMAVLMAMAMMLAACGAEEPEAYCAQLNGLVAPTCDGMVGDGECAEADAGDEDWQVDCGQFGGNLSAYASCDGWVAVCRSAPTHAVTITVPRCVNTCKL